MIGDQWKQKAGLGRKRKGIGKLPGSASLYGKEFLLVAKFKEKGIVYFV